MAAGGGRVAGCRVVVTGAAGRLGRAMCAEFGRDASVAALTRTDLDITDGRAVGARLAAERPDIIVNCAGDNDVDLAEGRPVRALEVNAFAVKALARAADEAGAALVHFSSDFVFDGEASRPYTEADEPNPRSVYAASKLLGEWFALEARRSFVLRVESLFGPAGAGRVGSLDRIVEGIRAGAPVPVFVDRTVSPAYVADVAWATRRLIEGGAPGGLYHCVNAGAATWREIALEIARLLGREPRLTPTTLDQAALRASRPRYSALDISKLGAAGIVMPGWQTALARYLGSDPEKRGQAETLEA